MKINKPENSNYCATVVKINTLVPLEGCDFVQAAIIFGNQVIVSKNTKIGDIGLFFPVECQLSHMFVSNNNLYRNSDLNLDKTQKGYFEENRRIRCVKFRGHKSEGFYIPISSISYTLTDFDLLIEDLPLNTEFDTVNDFEICKKYIINVSKTPGLPGSKKSRSTKKYESKLVDNQFRFHQSTDMLYKNLHMIKPEDLISITYKLHGTSGISSYVLCKRQISLREKIGGFFHNIYTQIFSLGKQKFKLESTEYDYLYSSRKVIKNEELNPNAQHYYNEDIWGLAHKELEPFLIKGMTLYYEIVGYLPNGVMIQEDYDYSQEQGTFKIYIYRITYTNIDGKVFEFSAKQVQNWCKKNGLNPVPELFYGFAKDFSDERMTKENWQNKFLETIKSKYNEKDCYMCANKVPEEGVVIRVEGLDFNAYKAKSTRFYEYETKRLDSGQSNIESEN